MNDIDWYGFYSLAPSYDGENNDTYKGVPCKISIFRDAKGNYIVSIEKVISERLTIYKKSIVNFKAEDEGNLWVYHLEEDSVTGAKYVLTVSYNGYSIGLTYYPNKQKEDVLIKYNNPIFYWSNWGNFKLFENINKISETEISELNNYCRQIVNLSDDVETVEFFKVLKAYIHHYHKKFYVEELNDKILINKALEELEGYLITCICDLKSIHSELSEQQMDGGIIAGSEFKLAFINTRKQLNYLLAFRSILNSLLNDLKTGVTKQNSVIRNKIYAEQNKDSDDLKTPKQEATKIEANKKSNSGCVGFFACFILVIFIYLII